MDCLGAARPMCRSLFTKTVLRDSRKSSVGGTSNPARLMHLRFFSMAIFGVTQVGSSCFTTIVGGWRWYSMDEVPENPFVPNTSSECSSPFGLRN